MSEPIEDYCIHASKTHPWALEAGTKIKALQAENERLLAARRADAWAMVMMAVQRETSIPALVPTEGASGGEAI